MISKLMEEANEAADHKAFCDAEMSTNKQTRDSKATEAEGLKADIEGLTADIAKLAEEITDLASQIAAIDESWRRRLLIVKQKRPRTLPPSPILKRRTLR